MSSAITERIADICDLARLNTELVVMARRRGRQEAEQINEYLRSLEFQQRAEALEPRVRAELRPGSACVVTGDCRCAWGSSRHRPCVLAFTIWRDHP